METTRRDLGPGTIRLLFEVGTVAGLSDGRLLDRFLDRRGDEEAAEVAFAALVERHGPMVLRICRARLGDEHDAQDAFQATFLILARKAGSIRKRDSASSWLQGVARRVASCARRSAALRRAKERTAAGRTTEAIDHSDRADLVPAVREEVGDLPEKYRTPLVLCLLDGLTHEEAATRLGWPVGTVKTRVRHAKDRLRTRLARRGLAPSLGAIGAALAANEASAMPAALVRSTASAALRFAAGRAAVQGILSASVANLVKLGLGSLIMSRLKVAALVITSAGALAAGTNGLARQASGPRAEEKPAVARPVVPAAPAESKPVAAEVAGKEFLDQLEMAKIDLELFRKQLADFYRSDVMEPIETIRMFEGQIEQVRTAKNLQDLKKYQHVAVKGNLEESKKRAEDYLKGLIDERKVELKQSRSRFADMRRQLRREEQRVKDMEDRAAEARPELKDASAASNQGADDPVAEELGDRLEAAKLDVEFLRFELAGLQQNVTNVQRSNLQEKIRLQTLMSPTSAPPGFGNEGPFGGIRLTGKNLEVAKTQSKERIDLTQDQYQKARDAFLTKSRELRREERRLRDLEGRVETRAVQTGQRPTTQIQQPAGIDRRLSDVERKLDLILKALGNQGREAGKK